MATPMEVGVGDERELGEPKMAVFYHGGGMVSVVDLETDTVTQVPTPPHLRGIDEVAHLRRMLKGRLN